MYVCVQTSLFVCLFVFKSVSDEDFVVDGEQFIE